MLTKKWAVALALGVGTVLAVSACSSNDSGSGKGDSSSPVVLSLLAPIKGSFSDVGTNLKQGAKVAIDQINASGGVLGGRKLSLEVKDTSSGPQQSAQAIRDFTSNDKSLLFGELSSANCLADAPLIDQLEAVFITTTCTNQKITGEPGKKAPFERTFRTGATDIADMIALYKTMQEKYPDVTTYDVFAFDYVSGHEEWEQFRDGLKQMGVDLKAGKEYFVPLDEQNYGSQISNLAASSSGATNRGLYLGTYGSGTGSFLKQARSYDVLKNYKVVVNPGGYYPIARELGGKAPDLWNGYDYNYTAYDSEANKKFVDDFEKLAGKKPVTWSYQSYLAVKAYAAAIDKAKSTDPGDVAKALEGISFDSPQGKFTIDAKTHQGSANIVITHTVGDPNAPEGLKIEDLVVVKSGETQ